MDFHGILGPFIGQVLLSECIYSSKHIVLHTHVLAEFSHSTPINLNLQLANLIWPMIPLKGVLVVILKFDKEMQVVS